MDNCKEDPIPATIATYHSISHKITLHGTDWMAKHECMTTAVE